MRRRWTGGANGVAPLPHQVVRGGPGDAHGGVRARFGLRQPRRSAGAEVDQLVLGAAPGHRGWVALGRALHHHLLHPADAGPVGGQGRALHDHPQPFEALGHHVGRHEPVGHGRGPGARAGREDEGVGAVVGRLGHHLEGALEVVVGLAGEADDEVGGDGQVRHRVPGGAQAGQVPLGRVPAPHGRQHLVAPRLEGQVQVVADRRRLGHGGDGLGAQVLRVRAGEAHPPDALDGADGPQQRGEERAAPGQVAAVGVHVLAEQRDLGHPPPGQLLDLVDDDLEGTRHLAAAHRRARCRRRTSCHTRPGWSPMPRRAPRARRRARQHGRRPSRRQRRRRCRRRCLRQPDRVRR